MHHISCVHSVCKKKDYTVNILQHVYRPPILVSLNAPGFKNSFHIWPNVPDLKQPWILKKKCKNYACVLQFMKSKLVTVWRLSRSPWASCSAPLAALQFVCDLLASWGNRELSDWPMVSYDLGTINGSSICLSVCSGARNGDLRLARDVLFYLDRLSVTLKIKHTFMSSACKSSH